MAQLAEIESFVAVVEAGGFRAAAARAGLTPSAVSKRVRALEDRLGARLLNRTTRRVAPTDVGRALFERARAILADLEDAECAITELQAEPRGPLRIGAPMDFGRRHLVEVFAEFAAEHPAVTLDVHLTDRFVDVVGEGFDLVVRIGTLSDSSLVARRLAPCKRALVAAPAYLRREGTPQRVGDLPHHALLAYTLDSARTWPVEGVSLAEQAHHRADNGEMLRSLARAGAGIALLPTFLVGDDLRDGSLVELLPGQLAAELAMHAVTPHRKLLSTKVQLLIARLRERFGADPSWDEGLPVPG
ncbi:MAG: LysR substrate-binding domain-containing protein [Myxococcota bacterium]